MQSNGKIFFASFMTLIAAGVGFAVRGDVLAEWSRIFGFTKTELGTITGGGLTGMAFTIIGFSLFADRVGYKAILIGAFLLHVLSAIVHIVRNVCLRSSTARTQPIGACTWACSCSHSATACAKRPSIRL